jgi:Uma2 family endonuclease
MSEVRHEYFAGKITAMAGGTFSHNLMTVNLSRVLATALEDSPCRVCSSDMRVRTRSTLYTYPDVAVVCAKPEFEGDRQDILTNPTLIAEVLSASTEDYDRGKKFEHYRSIASLQTYMLLSQSRILVEQFEKQPTGDWLLKTMESADDTMTIASLNVTLKVADLYKKVDFSARV